MGKWRPRGKGGLSSCLSRFITLARASLRRRGLRSRGSGSPMTNVSVSRQQAPPGPATPSAQQAPGRCLRVSVSGKELLKAQSLQKGYKDSSAFSSPRSPGAATAGGGLRPGIEGTPSKFWGLKSLSRAAGSVPSVLTSILPRPLPKGPASTLHLGLGRASGRGLGEACPGGLAASRGVSGLDLYPRALKWQRPPGRSSDEVGLGAQGAVCSDLRSLGLQALYRQCSPCPGVGLGKTGGERARGRGKSGATRAAAAKVGSLPSCGRRRGGSGEARRADKRGSQHLQLPGRVISTGWERSVF